MILFGAGKVKAGTDDFDAALRRSSPLERKGMGVSAQQPAARHVFALDCRRACERAGAAHRVEGPVACRSRTGRNVPPCARDALVHARGRRYCDCATRRGGGGAGVEPVNFASQRRRCDRRRRRRADSGRFPRSAARGMSARL
ncbi:hypothetical protein AQ611_14475 [Burkholderia singularis]|nr:hypothetical protein AQ611_14475 [Burkholderia sp. Bp7605]